MIYYYIFSINLTFFSLGFCFIEFASESIVDRIVKQKYHTVAGKRVSLVMIFCSGSAFYSVRSVE